MSIINTALIGKLKKTKQDKLVAGTNIKTLNGDSLLGSGNINITGGGSGGSHSDSNVGSDTFIGDGTTTSFDVTLLPITENHIFVNLNGVVQDPSEYTIVGKTVTLNTAPAIDDNLELRVLSVASAEIELSNYFSYVYTISTDTTSVSASDDNGNTLAYTVGKQEVYVNGIRLVDGSDYQATDGTSITFLETIFAGSTIEVVSLSSTSIIDADIGITPSSQYLATTDTDQVVDYFIKTQYRSAKWVIQMGHDTSGFHTAEVLLVHDGTNAHCTVYGEIFTQNSLGSISAQIVGDDVQLLVTPVHTNTTVKAKRISIEV